MEYFGTDGIRGVVNKNMTSELAYKVGYAIGKSIILHGLTKKVIIGHDTRLSSDLLQYSLSCGLMDMGIDCYMIGIVPTACVSYLAKVEDFGYAVMITASHNTWDMNGIKVINRFGYKCNELEEQELENNIESIPYIYTEKKGKIYEANRLVDQYIEHIYSTININLSDMNIALDLANGSNYALAPTVFKKYGANIVCVGADNDGKNINNNCGAQHIELLQNQVLEHHCDIGFAFDGDADRLRVVLKDGQCLDGDDILYIFAKYLNKNNKLLSSNVVGTIMTNDGLDIALQKIDVMLTRVDVGDKNVIDRLSSSGYILGGEPSGHIANLGYNTTCDALMNALFLLQIIKLEKWDIKSVLSDLIKYPSVEKSVIVTEFFRELYRRDENFKANVDGIAIKYNMARIIIRPSGTEPVFRIYVEGINQEKNKEIAINIEKKIKLLDKTLNKNNT